MQKTIGKYTIEATVGEGSFGKVYLTTWNGQNLALKSIVKKGRSQRQISNLKTQTNILARAEHENIIKLKDCFQTKDELVVVMQYAETDLQKVVKKVGKLPDDKIRMYARQILNAMLELHKKRILHRDLKPQNILLKNDVIKICDFGFAKEMSASTNFLKSVKGTPLYIAPEILLNRQYNHKVDVWSFGIILFELATGHQPFYANTIHQLKPKILHESVRFPSYMDTSLRNLIDGMLQKSERRRFDWQQVKNHKFFTDHPEVLPYTPNYNQQNKQIEEEPQKVIQWNSEEEIAYIYKMDSLFAEEKISIKELKFSEQFCTRVTQLIGEVCIDRTKVPKAIVLKAIKLVTKLAMKPSEDKDNQEDITKNKTLMTALVTLAQDESDEELFCSELELVGYLLKQNYNRIKIDTDHDQIITNIAAKVLAKKQSGASTLLCLKVLGILTSQAVLTLAQSEQYFERVAEDKLLTLLAEIYFEIPEKKIVLQCLEKFIHPVCNHKQERIGRISHKTMFTFRQLREQVAAVMFTKGFISSESISDRTWSKGQLELYCEILMQCLDVSGDMRTQFLKYTYWQTLLSGKTTRLFYLSFTHIILKHVGINLLNTDVVQSIVIQNDQYEILTKTYLLESASYKTLKNQGQMITKGKIKRVEAALSNIQKLLNCDSTIKKKNCEVLLGTLVENGEYIDTILIDTLVAFAKEYGQEQSITQIIKVIVQDAIVLKLPENSLLALLELISQMKIQLSEKQCQHLRSYLITSIKTDAFEDYLSIYPANCSKLLQYLLEYQFIKFEDQTFIRTFVQLIEQHNFLQLLFSQQISSEEMVMCAVRLVNKVQHRMKKIDFLINNALQSVKNYFKTSNQDFRFELVCFCGHLAKISKQNAHEIYMSGIVEQCPIFLKEGNISLQEKTLHMIGNISKFNDSSHNTFRKHKIVEAIAKCLEENPKNKPILKNTIYAIGNISFHSNTFACEVRPIIKLLAEGLSFDDDHMLVNTLSTINNLIRHGPDLLTELIDSGILDLTIELYRKANSINQVTIFISVIKKAMAFPLFKSRIDKDTIKLIKVSLEQFTARGFVRKDDRNAIGLMKLLY